MKKPTTLRLDDGIRRAIEDLMRRTGRDFSSVANEMLEEAVRMRRIPGVTFADGPAGRRARIAGTGLDVFEVVKVFRNLGMDRDRLQSAYHWLTPLQLRAALAYADAYPLEIEDRLSREDDLDAAAVHERYPFTAS